MEAEDRLDQVFINAFEANHPAMLDWVAVKFELKELRATKSSGAQPPQADNSQSDAIVALYKKWRLLHLLVDPRLVENFVDFVQQQHT